MDLSDDGWQVIQSSSTDPEMKHSHPLAPQKRSISLAISASRVYSSRRTLAPALSILSR